MLHDNLTLDGFWETWEWPDYIAVNHEKDGHTIRYCPVRECTMVEKEHDDGMIFDVCDTCLAQFDSADSFNFCPNCGSWIRRS